MCSVNCLYANKLDASVHRILPAELQSNTKQQQQQQQQVIVAEMGDTMENNHNNNDGGEGDAVRKVSTSEETEKDDKFPQQMAHNKNSNWNTMELGEKRKRLR